MISIRSKTIGAVMEVRAVNDLYRQIAELAESGRAFAVATIVSIKGSAPRDIASKMIILADGTTSGSVGGGGLEKLVTDDAINALVQGRSVLKNYKLDAGHEGGIGMACGGDVDVFIEVHCAPRTLLICGAGHVGQALAHAAVQTGIPVMVVDSRDDFADSTRFPSGVHAVIADPAGETAASLVNDRTYIVVMTHSHESDLAVLRSLLPCGAAYIGMIGSKRKVKTIMGKLKEEGFDEGELSQVHTPIGLDIGAETPEEIAISILAEIIRHYRKGDTSPESMREKNNA
jgi:xanthine dehydrogenase accessory factor